MSDPHVITFHIDDWPVEDFTPIGNSPGYRWRALVALIRRPDLLIRNPTAAQVQPGDTVVAFFSGPSPAGWTQVEGSPGVFYRRWGAGDE